MEHLKSRSHLNPKSTSKVSLEIRIPGQPSSQTPRNRCQARLTVSCRNGDGLIEPDRAKLKSALYCRPCARRLKLNRNAAYKQQKRSEVGWRAYQNSYVQCTSYEDPDTYRKHQHREYMRAYREWLRFARSVNLSPADEEFRQSRNQFIKAWCATPAPYRVAKKKRSKTVPREAIACLTHLFLQGSGGKEIFSEVAIL
jgi:hypothetical protein